MKNWMLLLPVLGLCALTPRVFRGVFSAAPPAQNRMLVPPPSAADSAASFQRGKLVYKTYCLSCHQFDGGGVENLNPPIIKTPYVLGNKTRLINIILHGFAEKVEIEGESYSNNMPAIPSLTDQQITDVLTYVRNDFGNKAAQVKLMDVRHIRGASAKK